MNRRKSLPPGRAKKVTPGMKIPEYQEPITITLDLRYEMPRRKVNILYSLNNFLAPIGTDKAVNNYWLKRAKDAVFLKVRKELSDMNVTPIVGRVMTQLVIYRGTNHEVDMGNYSVLEKFATDAATNDATNDATDGATDTVTDNKVVYFDDNYSILEKYATDAIVKTKLVYYDDNWKYIRGLVILDGGLDRENPRAEYSVIPASQYVFPKGI